MPRIEPIRLLNCLSVLLAPTGGIKNKDVIFPLSGLMTKYSKKLVSKCIYVQILKCTGLDLLSSFMGCGGWRLVHTWLTESIVTNNWPLVRELLELLLLCPVDIETLKTNNNPKLVKELSKDENHFDIRILALKLVEQWLKIVKGEQITPIVISDIPQIISDAQRDIKPEVLHVIKPEGINEIKSEVVERDSEVTILNVASTGLVNNNSNEQNVVDQKLKHSDYDNIEPNSEVKNEDLDKVPEAIPILKLSLKNGKQVISQVDPEKKRDSGSSDRNKSSEKLKSKSKDKDDRRSSSSSSKSSSSKHSNRSSSSSDKNKHSSSKHSESKDKSRDKDKHRHSSDSSKSKHSSSSSNKKSSSSSSKSREEKKIKQSSDKNKEDSKSSDSASDKVEEKHVPSIQKLGKIPKLSDVKKEKPSISIEVRKPEDPKPKTVKTFHSRFRKHGLEEEVKPPPSRASLLNKKPLPVLPPTVSIPKRPSPVHNDSPPEKKSKTLEINKIEEKPGSIKLIPPKPKRNIQHWEPWPLTSANIDFMLNVCCEHGPDLFKELDCVPDRVIIQLKHLKTYGDEPKGNVVAPETFLIGLQK